MSAIAGIIRFDGAPVDAAALSSMTAAQAHRGPDGIQHWLQGPVGLGQCMFRTTPESLEEHQPLANEDQSLVLVMDGRVDNYADLRRDLLSRGAILRDRSDAELVLRAYELWGEQCPTHIDGDFAWLIWDIRQQKAFCARDRMGHKPFNYFWDGKTFIFASELHAIFAFPGFQADLDEATLAEFLDFDICSCDATFWQTIKRLRSGYAMRIKAEGLRQIQYWLPDLANTIRYRTDKEYIEHYRTLLADCVNRTSRSHQPVSIEVSGGLDSSAVFGMAEQLRREGQLSTPSIQGLTLDFSTFNDPDSNEIAYARAVADFWHVGIKEIPASLPPFASYIERARFYRDFPDYPNSLMSLNLYAAARAAGSRVLLTGQGGDEWTGGTRYYYLEALANRHWRDLQQCLWRDSRELGLKNALFLLARFGLLPLLPAAYKQPLRQMRNCLLSQAAPSSDADAYLSSPLQQKFAARKKRRAVELASYPIQRIEQRYYIGGLSNGYATWVRESQERLLAQNGLEVRHPLRDYRLVDFAYATPERLRLLGINDRLMHRQACKDLLPLNVLSRQDKADFSVVFQRRLQDLPLESLLRRSSWINEKEALSQYQAHQASSPGLPMWRLWALAICNAWLP